MVPYTRSFDCPAMAPGFTPPEHVRSRTRPTAPACSTSLILLRAPYKLRPPPITFFQAPGFRLRHLHRLLLIQKKVLYRRHGHSAPPEDLTFHPWKYLRNGPLRRKVSCRPHQAGSANTASPLFTSLSTSTYLPVYDQA